MKRYPHSFFYMSTFYPHQLIVFLQVTIEIETNPPKSQEGTRKEGKSAEEEREKVAESFQVPAELLD